MLRQPEHSRLWSPVVAGRSQSTVPAEPESVCDVTKQTTYVGAGEGARANRFSLVIRSAAGRKPVWTGLNERSWGTGMVWLSFILADFVLLFLLEEKWAYLHHPLLSLPFLVLRAIVGLA